MRAEIDRETLDWLTDHSCSVEICGSQITCDPPPEGSDTDYLVHIKTTLHRLEWDACEMGQDNEPNANQDQVSDIVAYLTEAGYALDGGGHYQDLCESEFASLRRGGVNLILTANPAFARRHRAATYVCQLMNVREKAHRIAIFQAVLYGNQYPL